MDLGRHSLSLTVNDIVASKEFYERLGFTMDTNYGGVDERWIIMVNGTAIIGLFQGAFPRNTLTFNPTDARAIYHDLAAGGATFAAAGNIENESGPCYFMLTDPDGNPVLVDQHF